MDLILFKKLPYFDVIQSEYIILCERGGELHSSPFHIPFVGDLNKDVLQSVESETADKLIEEAHFRGDFEIYGMDLQQFLAEAYSGTIEGFRNTIPFRDIQEAVFTYLIHGNVSHLDYYYDVINPPVRSVW